MSTSADLTTEKAALFKLAKMLKQINRSYRNVKMAFKFSLVFVENA